MSFDALLGNDRVKENLNNSLARGRISHFYLICGPEGSGKHTLARLLAAAILCREQRRPCGVCPACRKVMAGAHPDFITVDDPEKKTVPVDLIRQARADIYIQPNEAEHKIYLFPRAQDMGIPGQNALLKVLEEPPAYGVFILLSDNPQKLLPTVRSRCVELTLQPLTAQQLLPRLEKEFPDAHADSLQAAVARSGGWLGQARQLLSGSEAEPETESFVRAFARRSALELVQTLVPMEKWKRDRLAPMLDSWAGVLEGAIACRAGLPSPSAHAQHLASARSTRELMDAVEQLQKAAHYTRANVSPAAVCGWLCWVLR